MQFQSQVNTLVQWLLRHPAVFWLLVVLGTFAVASVTGLLRAPPRPDELEYLDGAAALWSGADYRWGYRPPLTSAMFSPFARMSEPNALLASRLLSGAVGAIAPTAWLWAAGKIERLRVPLIVTALCCALWPPHWALSVVAMAEGVAIAVVSAVLAGSLVWSEGRDERHANRLAAAIGVLLAVGVLAKANLALLAPPWALWALACGRRPFAERLRVVAIAATVAAALFAPWEVYMMRVHHTASPTTSGGVNLLSGAGGYSGGTIPEDSIVRSYAERHGWDSERCDGDAALCAAVVGADRATVHREAGALASQRWREQPAALVGFGFVKFAHSLGGSLRGAADAAMLLFALAGLLAAAFLASRPENRAIAGLFACVYVTTFATTFIYLPNIRFKVPVVDAMNIFVIASAALLVAQAWRGRAGRA